MNRETIENILNFLKEKEDKRLPINWKIFLAKENIIRKLENHPDGTQYRYDGMLDLSNTNITKLPDKLHVEGNLILENCIQLTELPDNLYVKYALILDRCKQITELPNKLFVEGDLFLRGTIFATEYSDKEIKTMVKSTGGKIKGQIIRYY